MKRYMLTDYTSASEETKAVYDDFMRTTGSETVPIWLQSLGHSSALTKAYWERAKGTLFSGSLPLPLKEMIVYIVSARHEARYCSACHAQNVLSLDKNLSLEDLQSFLHTDNDMNLPVYYKSVSRFVDKAAREPNCMTDEDFEVLMDEGFTQEEIIEIVAVIDLASMFNVYTSTLGLDLDPQYEAIL